MKWWYFAIFFIVAAGFALPKILESIVMNKVTRLVQQGHFDQAREVLKQKNTKWFLEPYTIDYVLLQLAQFENDPAEIDRCYRRFDEVRLNNQQKITVYERAFYFYAGQKNEKMVRKYGKLLDECNYPKKEEIREYYLIMFEKSTDYLESYLQRLSSANLNEKARLEFLIAQMYNNKGNKEKAKEYINLSIQHNDEQMLNQK